MKKKYILEPIWDFKYNHNKLDKNKDYRVIGIRSFVRRLAERIKNEHLCHLNLGKVKYDGVIFHRDFVKNSFEIKDISWDIHWQTDRYLAIIIRDYLKNFIKYSPAIGNCVLRDNPEGIPFEEFFKGNVNTDVDYAKRWKNIVNSTANEFDEIRIMMESETNNSKVYQEMLQEKVDKAFHDLAYIFSDLSW